MQRQLQRERTVQYEVFHAFSDIILDAQEVYDWLVGWPSQKTGQSAGTIFSSFAVKKPVDFWKMLEPWSSADLAASRCTLAFFFSATDHGHGGGSH